MQNREYTVSIDATASSILQRDERIIIHSGDGSRTLSLHDYREIYKIPGLYERIFVDLFGGVSHTTVPEALMRQVALANVPAQMLTVLDLGAGVGMVGEYLKARGVVRVVGVDLTEEARSAAMRDRLGVYGEYFAVDLAHAPRNVVGALEGYGFNCLICVSSLNVVPARGWRTAFNLLEPDAFIAFNILEGALAPEPDVDCLNGSNLLVRHLRDQGVIETLSETPYVHRTSANGTPIRYVCVVGRKRRDIPGEVCDEHSCSTW